MTTYRVVGVWIDLHDTSPDGKGSGHRYVAARGLTKSEAKAYARWAKYTATNYVGVKIEKEES